MLALLDKVFDDADAHEVEEELASALQGLNPKGKLIERCTQEGWGTPRFDRAPSRRGHAVRAQVGPYQSHLHVAKQLKIAEHAAAAEVLACMSREESAPIPTHSTRSEPSPTHRRVDGRMRLNELRQVGVLKEFGYELVGQRGPSHQPTFVVKAWAKSDSGRRIEGEEVEARSKKQAECAAAEALIERLAEENIVGK
jgi:dsRNA-specific ribonuclease